MTPAGPIATCPCGAPCPPGAAYCSWRCRFEDDTHDYPIYDEDAA